VFDDFKATGIASRALASASGIAVWRELAPVIEKTGSVESLPDGSEDIAPEGGDR
jgi:hypothetical protein